MSTNLFCTSEPRQCDGREEAQQEPSRCQGEAAKTTEAGARARDHHDELFFGPKKAPVKQIFRSRQGCRASAVVALSWARCHSHRCCPCACIEVKRVDAAPTFPHSAKKQQPSPVPRPHVHDQGPPYWGQDCKCKKCTLPRDMASVLNLRWYDPLSTKTPHYVSKLKSLENFMLPVNSLPWPPVSAIHSCETQRGGSMQLPDPFPISYPT